MFRLKGEVEIVKIDSRTGEITQVIKQENLIPDNTLLELLNWNGVNNYFGSKTVAISTQITTPSKANPTVTEIIASGYVPSGITSPVWIETIEPPYGIIKNRIDFTGVARTFYTVALTTLSANSDRPGDTATASAYLLLTLPCTQGQFEFLDIQYRIQFLPGDEAGFIDEKLTRYDFGRGTFGIKNNVVNAFRISYLYASLCNIPTEEYYLAPGGDLVAAVTDDTESDLIRSNSWLVDGGSGIRIDDHYKWKYVLKNSYNTNLGIIYNGLFQGLSDSSNQVYSQSKYKYDKEPFQTGFVHLAGSNAPFFDPSFVGSTGGIMTLAGTWTGRFPEMYRVTITDAGATGTAKYKFSVMKHLGFNGNTFTSQDSICPYIQIALQPAPGIHGWRASDFDKYRYSNTQIVQYDDTGVTLLDIFDGTFTSWDGTTTPILNATQIKQVAVDTTNNLIYAGCRQTGLWIINPTLNTVIHQSVSPCYGVDVGRNNIAIAYFADGLRRSNNWALPLSFSYLGTVYFLKADPENADDQVAFLVDNAGATQVLWYDFATNTTTPGYTSAGIDDIIPAYAAALDCSDIGGIWIFVKDTGFVYSRLVYGNTTIDSAIAASLGNSTVESNSKVSFYQNKLFTRDKLFDIDTPANNIDYGDAQNSIYAIYLDSGITLFGNKLRQVFNPVPEKWADYGWDGSSWVLGNTGTKTTHTTADPLINGLTIKFTDGTGAIQFAATDFFTQGVNYGLLKDNATSIDSEVSQWYTRDVSFDTLYSGTIASTTLLLPAAVGVDFLRLETDTPTLHEFKINSVLVAAVYTAGEPPGINEVAIAGDGTVTFNVADVGKTFDAKYVYIKI